MRKATAGTFQEQARREVIVRTDKKSAHATGRCGECGAVYYDKHWHAVTHGKDLGAYLSAREAAVILCDECRIGSKAQGGKVTDYAGEVVLDGLTDPIEKSETLRLVRNVGKRAMRRDPEERIIKIYDDGETARVYTTENQLAVSIGKQVHRARKGGTLDITWSKQDKTVRVRWSAKKL